MALHHQILDYLRFLCNHASGDLDPCLIKSWCTFRYVKQNWLGPLRCDESAVGGVAQIDGRLDAHPFRHVGARLRSAEMSHQARMCAWMTDLGVPGQTVVPATLQVSPIPKPPT